MKRLKKILSEVLEIDENQINDETSSSNIETWDSFNRLMVVSELENEFKVKLTMKEVAEVQSVAFIKEILKSHGVKLDEG